MTLTYHFSESKTPAGKLADAEVHFHDGVLAGLKLIGFAVWESRQGGLNTTQPARQYTVHGERRSFSLLCEVSAPCLGNIRNAIQDAYLHWAAPPMDTNPGTEEDSVDRAERALGVQ